MVSLLLVMLVVASLSLSGKSASHILNTYVTGMLTTSNRGINEGRMAAREVDLFLEKSTSLPVTGGIVKRTAQQIFSQIEVNAA